MVSIPEKLAKETTLLISFKRDERLSFLKDLLNSQRAFVAAFCLLIVLPFDSLYFEGNV